MKLISDNPGIVMIKWKGENVTEISGSDPNRELGKMHISVSAKIEKEGKNYKLVWNEKKGESEILINLPQGNYAWKSVTIEL